ncbi:MAG: hypothetical protein U0P30_09225 [Vicinamibacterales bacterium]
MALLEIADAYAEGTEDEAAAETLGALGLELGRARPARRLGVAEAPLVPLNEIAGVLNMDAIGRNGEVQVGFRSAASRARAPSAVSWK